MHKPKTGALTQSYTYDARGNRATMTVTGTESYAVSYAYDANNRLLTEQKTQGLLTDLTTYTYDANGNLLSKTVLAGNDGAAGSTYVYNTLNQLVSATENQRTAAYAYNAQGIRTAKVTFSTRTNYLLDGANVVGERLNGEYVSYLRGANLISRTSGDETDFYLFNAHGDVTGLADSTGASTRAYDYDAFGVEKDPDPLDENPFRYCGEYFDGETKTYYLRARYYDPNIGRFTQQDTHWTTANSIYGDNPQKINEREDKLGLKSYSYAPQITAVMQSGNLYVYGVSNPIAALDRSGRIATAAMMLTDSGSLPLQTEREINKICIVQRLSSPDYINGQGSSEYSDIPFSRSNVGHSGCTVIATYNAFIALGHPVPFKELLAAYEPYVSFTGGAYGAWFFDAARVLNAYNTDFEFIFPSECRDYDFSANGVGVYILTLCNDTRNIHDGFHTIEVVYDGCGNYYIFNRNDGATDVEIERNFEKIVDKGMLIYAFYLYS